MGTEAVDQQDQVSNAYKNQHIRYIPNKKFIFDVDTPEGRMTKIFETDYSKLVAKYRMFKWTATLLLPTIVFGSILLPMSQATMLLPLTIPMVYSAYRH